uniref:HIT-type domain-containing protein n=1 Tax=Arcella intermedia TaxID=1963864 RepID=A0A6B2L7Y5_9EUKA
MICKKSKKKYQCPRCNLPYCSLACYKVHGEHCVEAFYQENVLETLKATKATSQDKAKITQILKRVKEADQTTTEQFNLIQKLNSLDLDSPDLFDSLSKEEQQNFLNLIQSGQISTMLEEWTPWWKSSPQKKLIEELPQGDKEGEDQEEFLFAKIPSIKTKIPPFRQLFTKAPSPNLVNNLVEILYSYAHTLRIFNGDWKNSITESVPQIYNLSSVLNSSKVYETISLSIRGALENALKPSVVVQNPREFTIAIVEDVSDICKSKAFILSALSQMDTMFKALLKQFKGTQGDTASSKQYQLVMKKLEFYLSWVNDSPSLLFEQLHTALCLEYQNFIQEFKKDLVSQGPPKKYVPIQEIN